MVKKIFPDSIYQKGKEYVKNNQVSALKRVGNLTHATVFDKDPYHVVIAHDIHDKMTGMSCTCNVSQSGGQCAHEAAVFIKIHLSQAQMSNSIEKNISNLIDIYNSLASQKKLKQNKLLKCFFDEASHLMYQIIDNKDNLTLHQQLIQIRQMMLDIMTLPISQQFVHKKLKLFLESFINLSKDNEYYEDDFIQWMKEILITPEYLLIHEIILKIFNQLPKRLMISLSYQLINQKDIQDRYQLLEYFSTYLIHYNQENQLMKLIDIFKKYQSSDIYHYLLIYECIMKEDYQQAYQLYQTYRKEKHFALMNKAYMKLEGQIYFGMSDCKQYENYVYQFYKEYENREDFSCLENLEILYGDKWGIQKYSVYDSLYQIMDKEGFFQLLVFIDEWQWVAYKILNDCNMRLFEDYKYFIRNHDESLYLFLYQECIIKYALSLKSVFDDISKIYEFKEEVHNDKIFKEVAWYIRKSNENNQIIVKLMDDLLKELNKK